MKKLSIFMVLVVLCTVLFTSCDKTDGKTTTEKETSPVSTTSEATTLSAEEQAAADKEAAEAKKCVETLLLSKDPDEMKKILRNSDDEYIQDVIDGFPDEDYVVAVKKLGDYKDYKVYFVELTRASDEEYFFDGIQIFAQGTNGLIIDLDTTIENEIIEKHGCRTCDGQGITGYDEVHNVEYVCDICDGTSFVF